MAPEFNSPDKWTSGEIIDHSGPLSYVIELIDVRVVRRNVDHICDCSMELPNDAGTGLDFEFFPDQSFITTSTCNTTNQPPPKPERELSTRRYPLYNRHPPDGFMNSHIQQRRNFSGKTLFCG